MNTMIKSLSFGLVMLLFAGQGFAQKKIIFPAADGLEVTANLYHLNDTLPYIILCHQAGSSRGEYDQTAGRFLKFRYNVIAVDLRSGKGINGVANETAAKALLRNPDINPADAEKDMLAAITYCFTKSKKKVILEGSDYSASLALKIAATDKRVKAVIAFSPDEYFGKALNIKESIKNLEVPVFTASTRDEAPDVKLLMADVQSQVNLQFIPPVKGLHGAKALWKENPNNQEYWFALVMFIRQVK